MRAMTLTKLLPGLSLFLMNKFTKNYMIFLTFDEKIPDVCAPNAPTDADYINQLHQFTTLMGQSIQKDARDYEKDWE